MLAKEQAIAFNTILSLITFQQIVLKIIRSRKFKKLGLEVKVHKSPLGTEAQAFATEKKLISLIGRLNRKTGPLTNLTDGGDGASGYKFTEEQRLKQSLALKGKNTYTKSEEHRQKISKTLSGRKLLPHSEARREALSKAHKGKIHSAEHRENNRRARLGKTLSEEHKRNVSKGMRGIKRSPETRERMRQGQIAAATIRRAKREGWLVWLGD